MAAGCTGLYSEVRRFNPMFRHCVGAETRRDFNNPPEMRVRHIHSVGNRPWPLTVVGVANDGEVYGMPTLLIPCGPLLAMVGLGIVL